MMNSTQKRTLSVLIGIGVVYFSIFIIPNRMGARDEGMLLASSVDEPITYPYVVRMVTPPEDLKDMFTRWVIYGDYHYGYPFYFLSAVVILPVVFLHGANFVDFTATNILLLRQLISVLPMILAAGVITFAQTRFLSIWKSVILFVLILSIRAVVRNDIQWWHPDALSVLAVVVTLLLLDRDQSQFGRHFWYTSVSCAFAIGIKLAGVFFAPAIALYLLAGLITKRLSLVQAAIKSSIFLLILAGVLVLTNPFLLNAGARDRLIRIQTAKSEEISQGYAKDDPVTVQKSPYFWEWTLSTWYAEPLLLGFLGLSLLWGCFCGPRQHLNRLILAWAAPYSIYLLWFVAVKPDHYWLPILIPVYSAALNLWDTLPRRWAKTWPILRTAISPHQVIQALLILVLTVHMGNNLIRPYSGILARFEESQHVEDAQNTQN